MSASYRIDSERGTVFSHASGVLTDDDLLGHQGRLERDPDFRPDYDQIFDFSDVTKLEATTEAIYALADGSPFGAGSRRAVAAPSDVVFGVARMFEALTSGSPHELKLFRDHDDALRWLGLQAADAARRAV